LPFVHWGSYERIKLRLYIERYSDPNGIGARVLAKAIDLSEVLRKSVIIPLRSYGLKVIGPHAGFDRALPEANGA
jgi:predicted RecB family nuclease